MRDEYSEGPEDSGPSIRPEASKLVAESKDRMLSYREHCARQAEAAMKQMEHWQKERAVIEEFLTGNALQGTVDIVDSVSVQSLRMGGVQVR